MVPVLLLAASLAQAAPAIGGIKPSEEVVRRVFDALRRDPEIQKNFTYIERRRDVKISRLGGVSIGPLRTFEVFPSDKPGDTYKRLIAVDGKPLPPEELARRDAERQQDLQREAERKRRESPRERAERLRKEQEERQRDADLLADARAVFEPTVIGRDTIQGRNVFIVNVKPRPNARVSTREGNWMKKFSGQVWIDEQNYQIVRVDVSAFEDITIGWGIIGRLHKGSRAYYTRTFFDGVWLPASLTYQATGRTLLFRHFEIDVTTTYSDYKRIQPSQ